jgi:hypothetical protein
LMCEILAYKFPDNEQVQDMIKELNVWLISEL